MREMRYKADLGKCMLAVIYVLDSIEPFPKSGQGLQQSGVLQCVDTMSGVHQALNVIEMTREPTADLFWIELQGLV